MNFPFLKMFYMVKDPILIFFLVFLTFNCLILPQMSLSRQEMVTANHVQVLYNKEMLHRTITAEKKRKFLKIWKNIIQPKTNKYKILKIHFINHSSPLLVHLFLSLILGLMVTVSHLLKKQFLADQLQYFVSGYRQLVYLALVRQVLLMFKTYPRFINPTKKIKFLKMVCWGSLASLYFLVPQNLESEMHFAPVGLLMFFAFKLMLTEINANHWPFMYNLNVYITRVIG